MLASPHKRALKLHIVSSRSWRMLWSCMWETIVFFSLMANFLIAVITSSTDLLVREPPTFLMRSFQSCSSQHSSSCMTRSLHCMTMSLHLSFVALVYSFQWVRKWHHSSLDPADDMVSRHTFLILAVACVVGWQVVCTCAWTLRSTVASLSFTSSVFYSHLGYGHLCFGVVCFPRGNLSS